MKNKKILITVVEAIVLVLIMFLIPAGTTAQIIIKTAVALVWLAIVDIVRRKTAAK